jgi:tRNA/tmRNA/rRNA uracil-C5-methylase (TrmA/RlmC/RlmD family)
MTLQPNTEITVTIEKPVAGGRMLARHEGQIVFVAGAIPGERVRARVERVGKHLAFAVTDEVLEPSDDRRATDVDWACGGSLYAHISYDRQLRLKAEVVADAFTRIAKMTLPAPVSISQSQEEGYRMRARLHAADGAFGFFREGTHELCDAAATRQLLPATLTALSTLQAALAEAGAERVLSCEISESMTAAERVMLIELEPDTSPPGMTPIEGISGVFFANEQNARPIVAYGSPYVTDIITRSAGSASLTRHIQSFFQGNRYLLPTLANRVLAHVPDGAVTDLFSGVGLFAVSLAAQGRHDIVAVEGDRSSAHDLEANAGAYAGAIHVKHVSVEHYLTRPGLTLSGTVVLDPPRTGLSTHALSALIGLKPRQIVYVSCDPPTLARDVRRFTEVGYRLNHIEAFDLFPNTAHVEILAVLSR